MRAVIDTTVWIGSFIKRDQWHSKAKPIIESFAEGKIDKVYVTDYIIPKTVKLL